MGKNALWGERVIRERRVEFGGFGSRALESPGEGAPLLLIHGFADSADCWRPTMVALAKRGIGATALDLPGFGRADRLDRVEPILPQLDRFLAAAVRDAHERSGGRDVVICGNSLGGCAAMRAAQDPDLPIAGIVPVAPAGLDMALWITLIESAPLVRMILRAPVPLPEVVVRESVGRVYRALAFTGPVDGAAVSSFSRHLASRRDVIRITATGRRLRPEIRDPFELDRIRCPVMIVWGDSDRLVFPTGANRVLEKVQGSRFVSIENCGHCPQVERPERMAELLEEFAAIPATP